MATLPLMGMSSFNITMPVPRSSPSESLTAAVSASKAPSTTAKPSSTLATDIRLWSRKIRPTSPDPLVPCDSKREVDAAAHHTHNSYSSMLASAVSGTSSPPESPLLQTPAFHLERLPMSDFEDECIDEDPPVEIVSIPMHAYGTTQPLSIRKHTTSLNNNSPSFPHIPLSTFHAECSPSFTSMASTHLHLHPWNHYRAEPTSQASIYDRGNFIFRDSDALMDLAYSRSFDDLLQCLDDEIEWNRVDRREWREQAEGVVGQGVEFWQDQAFM